MKPLPHVALGTIHAFSLSYKRKTLGQDKSEAGQANTGERGAEGRSAWLRRGRERHLLAVFATWESDQARPDQDIQMMAWRG